MNHLIKRIAALLFIMGAPVVFAQGQTPPWNGDYNPVEKATLGQRYEALVPDTLDLADRMGLAVNALTNVWLPQEKWALKFVVDFSRRPPVLFVNHLTDAYLNIPPKFLEALALCRLASGSTQNITTDLEVLRSKLELIGPDGLSYCPADTLKKLKEEGGFAEVWAEGRMLLALSILAQIDNNPAWIDIGKKKIDRMLALSRPKNDFRFLWKGRYHPGDTPPPDTQEPNGAITGGSLADNNPVFSMIYSCGALGHGAGLFYRVSKYEPALELSRGLTRWVLARMFKNEDGRYDFFHFHHGLYALMTVCEYGLAAQDRQVLQRVDACYRWAREMGDSLIGYYPEAMPGSDWYLGRYGNTVEICEVSDMVFLALALTQAGIGDYYDDVDRWVRNMYAQGQYTDPNLIENLPVNLCRAEPADVAYQDANNITQRMVGSFWGWMWANEGLNRSKKPGEDKLSSTSIMHCCTANGARTLYYVWDSIVTHNQNLVCVNLLLNRASPWLDVDSYLPVEGKVILHIKDAPQVAVRLPEWCNLNELALAVNNQPCQARMEGRYAHVTMLRPGDTVTLTFGVPTRVVHQVIGGIPYKLILRGAEVVDINPRGIAYPLFIHQSAGILVRKMRFIPQTQAIW